MYLYEKNKCIDTLPSLFPIFTYMAILKSEDVNITFGSAHDDDEYYLEYRDHQENPESFIALSSSEDNQILVYLGYSKSSVIMEWNDFEKLLVSGKKQLEDAKSRWLEYKDKHRGDVG